MNFAEVRGKYPQYNDLSDAQLAEGLHQKFYSDIPFNSFASKIGYGVEKPPKSVGLGSQILGAFKDYGEDMEDDVFLEGQAVEPSREHGFTGDWEPDIQPLKTLKEGAKDVVRNTAELIKGHADITRSKVRSLQDDPDIQKLSQDPDVIPGFIATSEKDLTPEKDEIANKILQLKAVQPEDLAHPGGFRGYVQDVIRMAPQMASQVGVSVVGGPVAGIGFMGTQIAGGHYKSLIDQGVEPERAFLASLADAAMQAPLEQIGVSKALRFWKPGKAASRTIKAFTGAGLTEFLTEWVQKYPELAADIWAKGKGKPQDEMFTEFLEGFAEATKEGIYEGLVAAPFGVGLAGAGSAYSNRAQKTEPTIDQPVPQHTQEDLARKTQQVKAGLSGGEVSPAQLREALKQLPEGHVQALAINEALKDESPTSRPIDLVGEKPTGADYLARVQNQEKIDQAEAEQMQADQTVELEAQAQVEAQQQAEEQYWERVAGDIRGQQLEQRIGLSRPTLQQPVITKEVSREAAPVPEKTDVALEGAGATIDAQAHEAATSPLNDLAEPTQKQKESGNYKKGHISVQGMDITIENPEGSERKGVSPEGKEWSTLMKHHYGYFKRTEGKDGDQIDTFVGPDIESPNVYIVDQVDPKTGKFNEHKVMTSFPTMEAAREGYLANYEEGWQGLGNITEMPIDEFKSWLAKGKQKKPVAPIDRRIEQSKDLQIQDKRTGEERRTDKIRRKKVSEMSFEERETEIRSLREEIRKDHITPLLNKKAFDQDERKKDTTSPVAQIDLEKFKWINDETTPGTLPTGEVVKGSYPLGDDILKAFGEAIDEALIEAGIKDKTTGYRSGGDEFTVVGATPGELEAFTQALEEKASKIKVDILGSNGVHYVLNGLPFSRGIGEGYDNAIKDYKANKADRTKHGLRLTGRSAKPATIFRAGKRESGRDRESDRDQRTVKPTKGFRHKKSQPSKVRTMRGAIKALGGIKFLNFKGELKDMPTAVKYLQRKNGTPIDNLVNQLIDDNWLEPGTSVSDFLENLRTDSKRLLSRDRRTTDLSEKKEYQKSAEEKKFEKELAREPETPPEGKYIRMNAEDLPMGKKLTLLEDKSPSGWDVYEVTEKDGFSVTLKDGIEIELKPLDRVEVLKKDLPKPSEAAEAIKSETKPDISETEKATKTTPQAKPTTPKKPPTDMFGQPVPTDMFGEAIPETKKPKRKGFRKKEKRVPTQAQRPLLGEDKTQIQPELAFREKKKGEQYVTKTTLKDTDISLEDVQSIFKGQKVGIAPDGTIFVKTKLGRGVQIKSVETIAPDKAAFEVGYSRMKASGELIAGKYQDGVITISKVGDKWTLTHESEHWMEDVGLINKNDQKALTGEIKRRYRKGTWKTLNKDDIGGKEDRAEFIAQELKKRSESRPTVQRVLQKIQDLIDAFANLYKRTARGVVRETETGKIYAKEGVPETRPIPSYEKTAQRWYSQMETVLEEKLPGKGTPESMKQAINAFAKKGEYKAEELEWSGITDWLSEQTGKVTKQEVLDYLRENNVQIREVVKTTKQPDDNIKLREDEDGDWQVYDSSTDEVLESFAYYTDAESYANKIREKEGATKFSQWQEPGATGYKEVLLTLLERISYREKKIRVRLEELRKEGKRDTDEFKALVKEGVILRKELPGKYTSGHWEEPNVLAHMRLNERTDTEGGKVLFLEEIQSDLHQEGRKKGYKKSEWQVINGDGDVEATGKTKVEAIENTLVAIHRDGLADVEALPADWSVKRSTGIPDAPFKKSWPMLIIKRAARMAAEGGFDSLGWTPGEIQAARYDLSKQISKLQYEKNKDGTYEIAVYDKKGDIARMPADLERVPPDKIADFVGKEVAQKMLDGEGKQHEDMPTVKTLSSLDLKVGGEGMKSFYDKMLVNEVNKFFNKKKWGKAKVAVGTIKADNAPEDVVEKYAAEDPSHPFVKKNRMEIWTLPITPEIKKRALREGMPMFSVKKPDIDPDIQELFDSLNKDMAPINKESGVFVEKMLKKRKKGWKKQKVDTKIISRVLSVPLHYFDKIPAMQRMFDAGLRWMDNKHSVVDDLVNSEDGQSYIKIMDDFRKQRRREYKRWTRYIIKRDQNSKGYSVSEKDGAWTLYNPSGKKVESFPGEQEAWRAAIDHEANDLGENGYSEQAQDALRALRAIGHNTYEQLAGQMRQYIKQYKEQGKEIPKIVVRQGEESVNVDLQAALSIMGDRRGHYMPRIRKSGRYRLIATKKDENPVMKFYDTKTVLNLAARKYQRQGYKIEKSRARKMPEVIFEIAGKQVGIQAMVNEALRNVGQAKAENLSHYGLSGKRGSYKGQDDFVVTGAYTKDIKTAFETLNGRYYALGDEQKAWHFMGAPKDIESRIVKRIQEVKGVTPDTEMLFAANMIQQVADIIRARGARSKMITRADATGKDVWIGYEEDPIIAMTRSAQGIAGAEAKRQLAVDLTQHITGTDIKWADYKRTKLDEGKKAKYPEYIKFVNDRKIDAGEQQNAFNDAVAYMQHMLRNDEQVDRIMATVKGFAVLKYLGGRVSAPVVNLTAMVTSVPATMKGYAGIPLNRSAKYIAKAMNAYRNWSERLNGKKTKLDKWEQDLFKTIEKNGWHKAQLNHEAIAVLQSKLGRGWNKAMELSMLGFGVTEQMNRVSTIAGTYIGIRDRHKGTWTQESHEKAIKTAKKVSDRAHGVYGKANLPHFAQGGGVGSQVVRAWYVFRTFSHNYLLTMYDLGFKKGQAASMLYMALSPALFAGIGASVFTPILGAIARGAGMDDPEEKFYAWLEDTYGMVSSELVRFGLFGAGGYGISLKGSLAIGVTDLPTTIEDIVGAPGSMVMDMHKGGKFILRGDYGKGIEKMMPLFLGNMMKAHREYTEGVTTGTNAPVFYGREQIKPDTIAALYRFLSFNPVQIAGKREKQWKESKIERKYQNQKTDIYAKFKRYFLKPANKRTDAEFIDLLTEVRAYNQKIIDGGLWPAIPIITADSIKSNIKRSFRPKKKELYRK